MKKDLNDQTIDSIGFKTGAGPVGNGVEQYLLVLVAPSTYQVHLRRNRNRINTICGGLRFLWTRVHHVAPLCCVGYKLRCSANLDSRVCLSCVMLPFFLPLLLSSPHLPECGFRLLIPSRTSRPAQHQRCAVCGEVLRASPAQHDFQGARHSLRGSRDDSACLVSVMHAGRRGTGSGAGFTELLFLVFALLSAVSLRKQMVEAALVRRNACAVLGSPVESLRYICPPAQGFLLPITLR